MDLLGTRGPHWSEWMAKADLGCAKPRLSVSPVRHLSGPPGKVADENKLCTMDRSGMRTPS